MVNHLVNFTQALTSAGLPRRTPGIACRERTFPAESERAARGWESNPKRIMKDKSLK
jgi:hypothetical protein